MAKILIIDDSPHDRFVVKNALEKKDHTILEVESGKDGIDLLKKESVDIVVSDLYMPEQDGLETLQAIKAIDADLPVILMSGSKSSSLYFKTANFLKVTTTVYKDLVLEEKITKEVERILQQPK